MFFDKSISPNWSWNYSFADILSSFLLFCISLSFFISVFFFPNFQITRLLLALLQWQNCEARKRIAKKVLQNIRQYRVEYIKYPLCFIKRFCLLLFSQTSFRVACICSNDSFYKKRIITRKNNDGLTLASEQILPKVQRSLITWFI